MLARQRQELILDAVRSTGGARVSELVDRLGVLGTGSSDYHGTGKTNHDLGVNTTHPEVYDELRKRLGVAV